MLTKFFVFRRFESPYPGEKICMFHEIVYHYLMQ